MPSYTAPLRDMRFVFYELHQGAEIAQLPGFEEMTADLIDAVLLVARPYLTTRDQVRGALAVLKRHPPKGMGLVINGSRATSSTYYHPAGVSNGRPARRGRVGRLTGTKPQGRGAHE